MSITGFARSLGFLPAEIWEVEKIDWETPNFLPIEMSKKDRKYLESVGVVFLKVRDEHNLVQKVILPAGWKKAPIPAHHQKLFDERGRPRATIFDSSASVYDFRAWIECETRFQIKWDNTMRLEKKLTVAIVTDCDVEVFRSKPHSFEVYGEDRASVEKAYKEVVTWLKSQGRDRWRDLYAYWNE